MSNLVEFIKNINTSAAQYVHEMEKIIFDDPGSAIVKGRKFLEVILEDITKYEEIDVAYNSFNLYEKISYLIKEEILDDKNIQRSFDTVRRIGNRGAHHTDTNEFADAFKIHEEIYNIAVWYNDLYCYVNNNKIPLYEPPKPQMDYHQQFEQFKQFFNQFQNLIVGKNNISDIVKSRDDKNKEKEEEQDSSIDTSTTNIDHSEFEEESIKLETENCLLEKNLLNGESYLIRELNRLRITSKEAVENADQFSSFKDYLHVDRPILNDLEKILEDNNNNHSGHLILLCGNVGDGKSHILAYLNKHRPDLMTNYEIYNDATESFSPNKDAMETLEESLSGFSDQNIKSNKKNLILAINMGVLHNFITRNHEKYTYNQLRKFVEESQLFTSKIQPKYSNESFSLLSFSDYNSFELTEKGAISTFYSKLLKKVVNKSKENPIYLGLLEDENNGVHTIVHENYKFLQNENVQENIIQLIINSVITDKLVISARAFLNFIADILIPNNFNLNEYLTDVEKLDFTLPNLLFSHSEKSEILNSTFKLDPLHNRSEKVDKLVIELNTLEGWEDVVTKNIEDEIAINWLKPFFNQDVLPGYSFNTLIETFIRALYLSNKTYAESIQDPSYKSYLNYLYHFNKGNEKKVIEFYEKFKEIIFTWKGLPKRDFIYINKPIEKYRIAQKLNLKPNIDHIEKNSKEILQHFISSINVAYENPKNNEKVFLEIDYPLYKILYMVKKGYRPNKKDEENAVKFIEFIDKLMDFGEGKEELLVYFKSEDRLYSFKIDDFGSYLFERERNYNDSIA